VIALLTFLSGANRIKAVSRTPTGHLPQATPDAIPTPPPAPNSSPPLPPSLKIACLAKHIEWLEAGKVAYEASDAALADKVALKDAVEEDLDKLEAEAMTMNKAEYRKSKWDEGEGFGTFDGPKNSLENWGDLPILRGMLEEMRKRSGVVGEEVRERVQEEVQEDVVMNEGEAVVAGNHE
jgi:hypothetical protein